MPDERLWGKYQIEGTQIIPLLDPDKVIEFYTKLVDYERNYRVDLHNDFLELFDPDTCPTRYLPYLASIVGLELDTRDIEPRQRLQIKSAVAWYKEKGKISSFVLFFRALGMEAVVKPLWSNKRGDVQTSQISPYYVPHARIDIDLFEIGYPGVTLLPEDIIRIKKRMEEVRPIHVLLRALNFGKDFIDDYVFPIDDLFGSPLTIDFAPDHFYLMGFNPCGIGHYYGARIAVLHNGWYFDGHCRKGTRINDYTGMPHLRGDPWQEVPTLIYRNNAIETFHDGLIITDRTGLLLDPSGRPYYHDGISGWLYDRSCYGWWEADTLNIDAVRSEDDRFTNIHFHDGEIPMRDGRIDRSGYGVIDYAESILISDGSDVLVTPSDATESSFNADESDVFQCAFFHDGVLTRRDGSIDRSGDGNVADGLELVVSGTMDVDEDILTQPLVYHDGTILLRDGTYDRRGSFTWDDFEIIIIPVAITIYTRGDEFHRIATHDGEYDHDSEIDHEDIMESLVYLHDGYLAGRDGDTDRSGSRIADPSEAIIIPYP